MSMKTQKIWASLLLFCVTMCALYAVEPLRNASPIMSGAENGLSPMSFGMTYSNVPAGFAFISSAAHPDIFVTIKVGIAEAKGFWRAEFDRFTQDGRPIYKTPQRVVTPWDNPKGLPSHLRVFQDGKDIFLLRVSPKNVEVARWYGNNRFEMEGKYPIDGIEWQVSSFDCIRRGRGEIEFVLLCSDGKSYRPETFKGDRQSYYDGAGIYRGELPRAGVFRFYVDNRWQQTTSVEQVSRDMKVIIGPSEIACVRSADGSCDGYLCTGILGAMKFIPYSRRIPKGGMMPVYVMKNERDIRTHIAYGSRLVAYPSAYGDCQNLMIGGESAVYLYSFEGMTTDKNPIYGEPKPFMQENSPVYGGSLTVPNVVDWNGDGKLDIVAGNSEGRLLFFRNDGDNVNPSFQLAEEICCEGEPIRFLPGYNIVQGPFEGAWGYLCPTVVDWNHDGLPDVVFSGSRAKYEVMLNVGTLQEPYLSAPKTIRVDNMELFGTWRVRPAVADINGTNVIVTMDDENALHLYRQVDDFNVEDAGKLLLEDGSPIIGHNSASEPLGQWGRGKLRFFDWNGDGKLDLFVGSVKRSSYPSPSRGLPYSRFKKKQYGLQVMYFENIGTNENMVFKEPVQMQVDGHDMYLGAHSNAPEPCRLGDISDGPNLIVGCENGKYFFFEHSHLTTVGIPK